MRRVLLSVVTAAAVGLGVFGTPAHAEKVYYCLSAVGGPCGAVNACVEDDQPTPLPQHTWCGPDPSTEDEYLFHECVYEYPDGPHMCVSLRCDGRCYDPVRLP